MDAGSVRLGLAATRAGGRCRWRSFDGEAQKQLHQVQMGTLVSKLSVDMAAKVKSWMMPDMVAAATADPVPVATVTPTPTSTHPSTCELTPAQLQLAAQHPSTWELLAPVHIAAMSLPPAAAAAAALPDDRLSRLGRLNSGPRPKSLLISPCPSSVRQSPSPSTGTPSPGLLKPLRSGPLMGSHKRGSKTPPALGSPHLRSPDLALFARIQGSLQDQGWDLGTIGPTATVCQSDRSV